MTSSKGVKIIHVKPITKSVVAKHEKVYRSLLSKMANIDLERVSSGLELIYIQVTMEYEDKMKAHNTCIRNCAEIVQ